MEKMINDPNLGFSPAKGGISICDLRSAIYNFLFRFWFLA
jgi:hypothetical protein